MQRTQVPSLLILYTNRQVASTNISVKATFNLIQMNFWSRLLLARWLRHAWRNVNVSFVKILSSPKSTKHNSRFIFACEIRCFMGLLVSSKATTPLQSVQRFSVRPALCEKGLQTSSWLSSTPLFFFPLFLEIKNYPPSFFMLRTAACCY